jgi:hypothetical protein
MRKLAGECPNLNDKTGGKSGPPASRLRLKARQSGNGESLTPLANNLTRRIQPGRDHVIGKSFIREEDDFGADQINWGTPMFSLSGERDGSPPIPGRNGRLQIAPETEGVARRLNSLIAQPTASRGASHGSYATWLFGY